jgi:hypothetical protein
VCGGEHTVVVLDNDQLWGTGSNLGGQLGRPDTYNLYGFDRLFIQPLGTKINEVVCGNEQTLVLLDTGEIWGTGSNDSGLFDNSIRRYVLYEFEKITDNVLFIQNKNIRLNIRMKSNILFPAGYYVQTDQETVLLSELNPSIHTISGGRIVSMTKIYELNENKKTLVFLEKESYL